MYDTDWIHVSQLEMYVKSHFALRTNCGCIRRNKACLQSHNAFENETDRFPLVINFDLNTVKEMINIAEIKEWIYSLSFCKIESMQIIELNLANNSNNIPEFVEIKLSIWPCKLRV